MDNSNNNQNSEKPRKRVTKKILRRRQLCALAVIALIVLILMILIANACTDKTKKPKKETTTTSTSTTQTTTETEPPTEMTTTTTTIPVPTVDPTLSAQVQLSTRELALNVGESDMPIIYGYPQGCSEENELWSSTDPNIATVDEYGNVTAVNAGECYILLKFNNNSAIEVQIKVTVKGNAPQIPDTNQQNIQQNIPDTQNGLDTQNIPDSQANYQDSQEYRDTQNYFQNNQQPSSQAAQDSPEFPEVSNVMPET